MDNEDFDNILKAMAEAPYPFKYLPECQLMAITAFLYFRERHKSKK